MSGHTVEFQKHVRYYNRLYYATVREAQQHFTHQILHNEDHQANTSFLFLFTE